MPLLRTCLFAALATTSLAMRAEAQQGPYELQEMNFDMWCQEERHLPPERCDKRLAADDAEYQAYVAKIENYEVPYLQRREGEQTFNRVVLHNDPVDHPTQPSAPPIYQPPPTN